MNENLTNTLEDNEVDLLTGTNQPDPGDTPDTPSDPDTGNGTDGSTGQTDEPVDSGETDPGEEPGDGDTDLIKDPAADDKNEPSDDGETGTGETDPGEDPDSGETDPGEDPDSGETDPGEDPDSGETDPGEDPDSGETDPADQPDDGTENGEDETADDETAGDEEGEEGDEEGEEGDETGELIETPSDEPAPNTTFNLVTGILLGVSVLLAVAVAVLATMLLLGRKKKRAPAKMAGAVGGINAIGIGKLHELGDRESQQDCFAVSPQELLATHGLLAVVADGMGGLEDGDKVSQAAVAAMLDGFFSAAGAPQDILLSLTEQANLRINGLLGPNKIGKCGSTMVAGLIRDGMFHYLSIGDSRICLYRDGQLIQLNREHVYRNDLAVQALSGIGSLQGAAQHPKAAGLTSFLGMGQLRYVDIPACGIEIRSGDKFILMSDGVYNALTVEELSGALAGDAQQAADDLRAMIAQKAYRHQDNYTAVILAC